MPVNAKSHYDHVTDAWKEFMGDNFHFGYFETEVLVDLLVAQPAIFDGVV